MDCAHSSENIREIEDIINIQKASGHFHVRQVGFVLPEESVSAGSLTHSTFQEFGISISDNQTNLCTKKKVRRNLRSKYFRSSADLVSWPSDSDITVLRMKLSPQSGERRQNFYKNVIPGDGLHLPDSSSMVNLATLISESQPSSKHILSAQAKEYLLALTSWDPEHNQKKQIDNKHSVTSQLSEQQEQLITLPKEEDRFDEVVLMCNQDQQYLCKQHQHVAAMSQSELKKNESNSSIISLKQTSSRIARFVRLYFCPCCTCLYKLENRCEQTGRQATMVERTTSKHQQTGR